MSLASSITPTNDWGSDLILFICSNKYLLKLSSGILIFNSALILSCFSFNTLFYFLGIPIPDVIYVSLKVILGSSGQNGEQEILATCKPKDTIIPEVDEQNGRTKQFKCEAFALGEGNISSVSYDSSKKVKTEPSLWHWSAHFSIFLKTRSALSLYLTEIISNKIERI